MYTYIYKETGNSLDDPQVLSRQVSLSNVHAET